MADDASSIEIPGYTLIRAIGSGGSAGTPLSMLLEWAQPLSTSNLSLLQRIPVHESLLQAAKGLSMTKVNSSNNKEQDATADTNTVASIRDYRDEFAHRFPNILYYAHALLCEEQ